MCVCITQMRNSLKLLKETDEFNKWKIIPKQWVGRLSTKKISAFFSQAHL